MSNNPYHEDDILNWLLSQFGEQIVFPCARAEQTYHEIILLRDVLEKTKSMLDAMGGDWLADSTEKTQEVVDAVDKYERWRR